MNPEIVSLTSEPVPPTRAIAGFWKRILAFVVDTILVCLPCFILGFVFFDFFAGSTTWGILIGCAITLPYFALMGSAVGGGQTLGHKIAHIQIVNKYGRALSTKQSFIRYSILLVPFLVNSSIISAFAPSIIQSSFDWLLGGAEFVIIYLYIFNVRTRQSLHDILTGAFVVDESYSGVVEPPPFWRGHWAIFGGLMLLALIAASFADKLMQVDPFPELITVRQAVLDSGKFQSVNVVLQTKSVNGQTSTGINVNVAMNGNSKQYEQVAQDIVRTVLKADPQAAKKDFIGVSINGGFRIGLATLNNAWSLSRTPGQWMGLNQQPEPNP